LCLVIGGVLGIAWASAADAQAPPRPPSSPANESAQRDESAQQGESDDFSLKLSGRVQADAAFFNEDKTRIGNGQEARRVRLKAAGTIHENWLYALELGFESSAALSFAEISYVGIEDVRINLGYFKVPSSLDYLTSSNYTLLQERSLLHDAFDSPKRIGASIELEQEWGGGFTAELGVFGQTIPSDSRPDGDSGEGIAGRATYAFVHEDANLLHLGASAGWRDPGDGETVRLSARPDAHLAPRLVDTDTIPDVNDNRKLGAEFAGVAGPLSVQAEYRTEQVNRRRGSDLHFSGWYAQAGYFLTGESQAASYAHGIFGRIDPRGRYGAWQLALRYDRVNLTDADFVGGEEANLTAGLNWYANRNLRMSMNYVAVLKLERPGNPHDHDRPDMLVTRVWLYF
jgi:phosphate-selective porin OprO/OprP